MQRTFSRSARVWLAAGLMLGLAFTLGTRGTSGQTGRREPVPNTTDIRVAKNFEFIGNILGDERMVFKLAIQRVNGRYYLYGGCAYHFGYIVVDVTDPADPKLMNFVPTFPNTAATQVTVAGGKLILSGSLPLLDRGQADLSTTAPKVRGGFTIWDVGTDPVNPKMLGEYVARGTHRNWYDGQRYVMASASVEGFSGGIFTIVDVSDPTKPTEVSRWWYPGQKAGEAYPRGIESAGHHGPAQQVGNLVYLAYSGAGVVVLDIKDIKHPKMIGNWRTTPPFGPAKGGGTTHTAYPIPDRNIMLVSSEAHAENCQEPEAPRPYYLNVLVDITDPTNMKLISYLPEPMPAPGEPYRHFCDKGGRFGPHNVPQHANVGKDGGARQGPILYQAYFNAGVRAFDISDPQFPTEVGYFAPNPTKRYGTVPFDKLVTNFEDILVDDRGYVYVSDRNSGIWIVKYTGPMPKPVS